MDAEQDYRTYLELADREGERGADQLRDRFLILAADAALIAGKPAEAEQLRNRLLAANPSHLLKPFDSMAAAIHSAEVSAYIADLRRGYPPEEAERLLQSLHGDAPTEEPPAPLPFLKPQPEADLPPPPIMPETAPPLIPPPYRPEPAPAAQADEDEDYSAASNVIAMGWYVIVLVSALALAGHVFVRPFVLPD